MISVMILINGYPLMGRSARMIADPDDRGLATYQIDDGSILKFDPNRGARELAKILLDNIKGSDEGVKKDENI
jgi:hypothetical protein